MKILVITQKYDINDSNLGAFIDWWDKLSEKMEKVYVLALEKRSESTRSNMEVLSMGKEEGAGFLRKIFGFYSGFFKTIEKVDAVLVHMIPKYIILSFPVAFILRKPIYMWYTGVTANWQLKLAVLFCKKVFTAHEAAMRINTPKRIITGHGIDVEKFKVLSPKFQVQGPITILSVGRITPSKGHSLIIEAINELISEGYNLKLQIIGGIIGEHHNSYLTRLKKLAIESGVSHRVEFLGAIPYREVPKYFGEARILINAVPFGGLDKVILEAMASCVIPLTSNSAFTNVFPEISSQDLIFKEGNLEDLKLKLKNIIDKKLYQDEVLCQELRSIVIRNHNLDNLIGKIVKEINQ